LRSRETFQNLFGGRFAFGIAAQISSNARARGCPGSFGGGAPGILDDLKEIALEVLGWRINAHLIRGDVFADYSKDCNLVLPHDATALLVADYDRDGKLDLYVTRAARPGKRSWLEGKSADSLGNFLFRNKGGWQFEDVTVASGTSGGHLR